MDSYFEKLTDWYAKQCNGDWEHDFGIKIESLDNPGWSIEIDTFNTVCQLKDLPIQVIENNEFDWYSFYVKDSKFKASCAIFCLPFVLNKFFQLIEQSDKKLS